MIGLILRHNIKIRKIIEVLDSIEAPVSSFIFRMKKFLSMFDIEEEITKQKCHECGGTVMLIEGCNKCIDCGYSKCG
jgi:hypothetical protein